MIAFLQPTPHFLLSLRWSSFSHRLLVKTVPALGIPKTITLDRAMPRDFSLIAHNAQHAKN